MLSTLSCAAIRSSISEQSSPITRSSPPQSGQQGPGSSSIRSRGVSGETRGRRRRGRPVASWATGAISGPTSPMPSSGTDVSRSALAISRSSSASSSCAISRSIFSDDWACDLLLQCANPQPQCLDQLIMGTQGCQNLGLLCLQLGDQRLQKRRIVRKDLGCMRHAPL